MTEKASRYERLALSARQDPLLARIGYVIAFCFMAVGVLDTLSTNWALSVGAYEINGFMRALQSWLGPLWFVPKMILQALVAAMIVWSPNRPTIFVMTFMTVWTAGIVANNFQIAYALS